MTGKTVTKGDFARLLGVSAGRVSQYLKSGIIGPEAIVGTGHRALLLFDVAWAHVRDRRDPGQANGLNGLGTRLPPRGSEALRNRVATIMSRHGCGDIVDGAALSAVSEIHRREIEADFLRLYGNIATTMMCVMLRATDDEIREVTESIFDDQLGKAAAIYWASAGEDD